MKQKEAMEASAAFLRWFASQDLDEYQSVEVMVVTMARLIMKVAQRDNLDQRKGVDRVHLLIMEQINRLEKKKAKK